METVIGMLMGAALGVMITLIFSNRDNVTITYSGYQPTIRGEGNPPSSGSSSMKPLDARCPNEHTPRYIIFDPKTEPVNAENVETKEAIKYFKADIEAYENMLGVNAKLAVEYKVTQLAIKALEEKLQYDTYIKAIWQQHSNNY